MYRWLHILKYRFNKMCRLRTSKKNDQSNWLLVGVLDHWLLIKEEGHHGWASRFGRLLVWSPLARSDNQNKLCWGYLERDRELNRYDLPLGRYSDTQEATEIRQIGVLSHIRHRGLLRMVFHGKTFDLDGNFYSQLSSARKHITCRPQGTVSWCLIHLLQQDKQESWLKLWAYSFPLMRLKKESLTGEWKGRTEKKRHVLIKTFYSGFILLASLNNNSLNICFDCQW